MRIIFIGMPGSGKGTQSELVAKRYGIPHISTGDIFRENISAGTPLGKKADKLIKNGKLVPDLITNRIVAKRISEPDCMKGFILDGYPRNRNQAEFLEKHSKIDVVVLINLDDETARKRIRGRYNCPKCGRNYNIFTGPIPKRDSLCDGCGSALVQRKDDEESSFWHRMEIYHQITEPLVRYYREKGTLIKVNGNQPVPDVQKELIKKLGATMFSK
jgi:adenylate kinase